MVKRRFVALFSDPKRTRSRLEIPSKLFRGPVPPPPATPTVPEEQAIVTAAPELADYVVGLKQRSRKVVTLALRQLLRLVREYPREPLVGAVEEAVTGSARKPGKHNSHGPRLQTS